ncbi:MAG: hypothetical protein RL199_149 [Pseudomonadota bacterium]|jgi:GDP-L-fucose synthase
MTPLTPDAKVYVAGHRGLVGSALVRRLRHQGFDNLLLRTREELDLRDQAATRRFFETHRPSFVFVAAAVVGGIEANRTMQSRFLLDNLLIEANVIDAALGSGVEKLLLLGSSCVYPRLCPQPIAEEALLTGPLEATNEGYALAKIAGLKLCEHLVRQEGRRFISAMPSNLYGPGDNFHPTHSHVVPGLMRRFHEARRRADPAVTVWGSGTPLRELLHVDDLAEALVLLMERYEAPGHINVGSAHEIRIADLARLVARIVGYEGEVRFDPSRPDGTPRKILDVSRLAALGWRARTGLEQGLSGTYAWALENGVLD